MKKICETCRFHPDEEPDHCRRLPPVALDPNNTAFPIIKKEWWCGEWKAKLQVKAKRERNKD